ncbi:amino acid permease, putative [Arabidopsis thaliana]|nr:amino acid permease, putative [Arabidopsis thaliana]
MVVQNVQDLDVLPKHSSDSFDDDGRPKRTGTVWTASAHIITAVIGSGVLSLAWAVAQIGWIGGPVAMLLFSFVTFYTSTLLCSCYRSGDSVTGKRNYTYMDAIHSNLGGIKVKVCGVVQYVNLFGTAIGYTIASAISLVTSCQQMNGPNDPCHVNGNVYMIAFGIVQIIFSQIPDFDQLWWLSIVAAVMSFAYSAIGLGLGVSKVVENKEIKGSLTGVTVGTVTLSGTVTSSQKIWRTFQSLGNIAFAYSYSMILIEIQDTVKSPPAEVNTMRKATFVSVAVTTVFYMLCGCVGYAAFGDNAPGNLLAHGGFRNPYWLLDIANLAIVIHLVGAYQVYCQPLFAFVEKEASRRFPESEFVTKEIKIQLFPGKPFNLNLFRLVWRTFFVMTTTLISMLMPFFNDVVGLLGAIGFWPLTVYFPVEMYIAQKNVPRWGTKWVCLQVLSVTCLFVSVAAAAGSVIGIVSDLKVYKPFQSEF